MDALVYDLEIVKGIPNKGEPLERGIEYCGGWTDHRGMGISVIGVYDFLEDRYRVFCKDNFQEFFDLIDERALRIGFNNVGFDNKVLNALEGYAPYDDLDSSDVMPSKGYYDILQELYLCAGRRFKGSGLNNICELNGLGSKSGHGALAPVLWQRGQVGAVIDYCLNDIKMTKDLFLLSQKGPIKSPQGLLNLRRV
jgi:hypothetical protein